MAGDLEACQPSHFIRYYSTLRAIRKDYAKRPSDLKGKVQVGYWYCGPSGTGKSSQARIENEEEGYYLKPVNKWWCSYLGEGIVIIDDVDLKHECLAHHFKIWGDRYAFIGEDKGSALYIRPTKVIVTSQYTIDEIFTDPKAAEAIHRRYKTVKFNHEFKSGYAAESARLAALRCAEVAMTDSPVPSPPLFSRCSHSVPPKPARMVGPPFPPECDLDHVMTGDQIIDRVVKSWLE